LTSPIINISALEPLYLPHEMPTHHRVRAKREGEPAETVKGRRPSDIIIAQNLRRYVSEWREADYAGSSDTTRELLHHWFERDHSVKNSDGELIPFKYYFCQREALEIFIYLKEVSGGFRRNPRLDNITIDDVKKAFSRFTPLPVGEVRRTEIDYEGRHLFTNEIIEKMKVQIPLLESGIGAVSFYREELERQTSLKGTHQVVAPLIQTFLEEILFEQKDSCI
jgi:hypothetical protein